MQRNLFIKAFITNFTRKNYLNREIISFQVNDIRSYKRIFSIYTRYKLFEGKTASVSHVKETLLWRINQTIVNKNQTISNRWHKLFQFVLERRSFYVYICVVFFSLNIRNHSCPFYCDIAAALYLTTNFSDVFHLNLYFYSKANSSHKLG